MNNRYTKIIASGSYIPEVIVKNSDFLKNKFFTPNKEMHTKSNEEIVQKLEEITGISERRFISDSQVTSDIAYLAAEDAFQSSGVDRESLDCIIVAHNFGDVSHDNRRSDFVPSIAARVKQRLGIHNPKTIAFDINFGCPGWLMGVIQADSFIKSGITERAMVIGAETLSRISDPADIDSMIYSDGAGATILEVIESDSPTGIIAHSTRSDTLNHAKLLRMDHSYNPDFGGNDLFLKMNGHHLYKYAIQTVPTVVKDCLDKVNLNVYDINKVFIHQANEKLDFEILNRVFDLYEVKENYADLIHKILPMSISWLGNSSVATIPTLYDMFAKGLLDNHKPLKDDKYIFTSVGAGMNINCLVYSVPE